MRRAVPFQGLLQFRQLLPQHAQRQFRHLFRVLLATQQRSQHGPPRLAQHVRSHRALLDVAVLQDLVDAVGHPSLFGGQLRAVTGQIAQVAHRPRRYEAPTQQATLQQLRNPFRIGHVTLAPGALLQMPGVDQQQGEATLQNIPDRLPQHAGGLQCHMRHAQRLQVVGHCSQIPGHRPKGADLLKELPGWLATADGTLDRLEMHVQPCYLRIDGVHDAPPLRSAAAGGCRGAVRSAPRAPRTPGATIPVTCRHPGQTPRRAQRLQCATASDPAAASTIIIAAQNQRHFHHSGCRVPA